MITPGIVAHNFMAWLKRTFNAPKGFTNIGPAQGVTSSVWGVSGYTPYVWAVNNDASQVAALCRNTANTQSYLLTYDLTTPGDISSLDVSSVFISTLPADTVYDYSSALYNNFYLFDNRIIHLTLIAQGTSQNHVKCFYCNTSSAIEFATNDVTSGALSYSLDGLHAYIADIEVTGNYELYTLYEPFNWVPGQTWVHTGDANYPSDIYNGSDTVSQDGYYWYVLDTGIYQYTLNLVTRKLPTPYDKRSSVAVTNSALAPIPIISSGNLYFDMFCGFSPNGRWIIGHSNYDLYGMSVFITRVNHYLEFTDADQPTPPITTLNITELDGASTYYSFASALTATRIVMDVFPLTSNAGLPTGVPSITAEVFQTLDFTLTGGSIQEIGRNGSTYFAGWIKNVTIYNGATVVAQLALDEVMTGGTAIDTSGNGNNATANNFVAANTVAYTDDGVGYVGPEMITPAILASPYLAENQWSYNSGTGEWTLTGTGSRSLLEFYVSTDQPSYFRIAATVVSINSEYLNFVINATGSEFVNTAGTYEFYCRKLSVTRQSFHRRVGGVSVVATIKDISLRAYLSTTIPL